MWGSHSHSDTKVVAIQALITWQNDPLVRSSQGTVENPVLVPSVADTRVVGCTGGTGDNEHTPLWFNCREGFLYRCGGRREVNNTVFAIHVGNIIPVVLKGVRNISGTP